MVYTYTGITRVLWGSLPSERMVHEEKRMIHSSQMAYSGIEYIDLQTVKYVYILSFRRLS